MSQISYKQRLESFQKSKRINNRSYKWRYTVIPSDYLSQIGFYFDPIKNEKNSKEVRKDAINCIYCNRHTFDLKNCRSKHKDKLETICNILILHLNGNNLNCPLNYLRLKLLRDHRFNLGTSNWKDDNLFNNPFDLSTRNFFRLSFIQCNRKSNDSKNNGGSNNNLDKNMINDIINAGLVKYDPSFSAFNELMYDDEAHTFFCIYCGNIIEIPRNNNKNSYKISKPIELHLHVTNGGHCYFFKMLREKFKEFEDLKNLKDFSVDDATETSSNSIVYNSLIYENISNVASVSSKETATNTDADLPKTASVTEESDSMHIQIDNADNTSNHDKENVLISDKNGESAISEQSRNHNDNNMGFINQQTITKVVSDNMSQTNSPSIDDLSDYEGKNQNENTGSEKIEENNILINGIKSKVIITNSDTGKSENKSLDDEKKENTTFEDGTLKHKIDDEISMSKTVDVTPMKNDVAPRKRRKLTKQSPQKINSDSSLSFLSSAKETDISSNKDLVLNFRDHVNRKKDITRSNKILDDSVDDFSFSSNGHSTFNIPVIPPIKSAKASSENFTEIETVSVLDNITAVVPPLKLSNISVDQNEVPDSSNIISAITNNQTDGASIGKNIQLERGEGQKSDDSTADQRDPSPTSLLNPNDLVGKPENVKANETRIAPENTIMSNENNEKKEQISTLVYVNEPVDQTPKPDLSKSSILKTTKATEILNPGSQIEPLPLENNAELSPPAELSTPTTTIKRPEQLVADLAVTNNNVSKRDIKRTISGVNSKPYQMSNENNDALKERLEQIAIDSDFSSSDSSSDDIESTKSTPLASPKLFGTAHLSAQSYLRRLRHAQ